MSETTEKLYFVVVHVFGHGAWCWYKIRSLLEASGYKVSCIDLKGSGMDPSDPSIIFSFQDYNKPLIDLLSNLPHNEKVILVGHSAGGMSLTYAIHRFSKKIRMAIYVAATMLKHGFVTPQDYEHGDPDLSIYGDVCKMTYGLGADQPPTSMIIKEYVPRVFIKTLQDRVLKQEQQEAMLKRWAPALVFALESDHSPFFSMPTLLFAFLLKAVASIKAAT
ncbi:hypothetical protein V6Z12_D03G171400 [Gossypium hirsutum]